MNTKFKIGDKVICFDDQTYNNSGFFPNGLTKNMEYTVTGIFKCLCGDELLELKEVPCLDKYCSICGNYNNYDKAYRMKRFKLIAPNYNPKKLIKEI
jgi:hypothetical protein